jgi:hypothetical protein
MQTIIFEIITDITRQKREAEKEPTAPLLREVSQEYHLHGTNENAERKKRIMEYHKINGIDFGFYVKS